MTRGFALPAAFLATVILAAAGDQSRRNKSEEPDSFDIEPPILKQNFSNFLPAATPAPDADVARLEKRFEQAKQNVGGAERLCKIGVLSKVELEQRLLRVVQCECNLANARVTVCKGEVAELESRVASGENAKDDLANARATLAQLTEAAQTATAKRERAELEAAEANLRRQQKLLKLGAANESDVSRAEEKLADLKPPRN
jgi:multidrug resistance efflux pump